MVAETEGVDQLEQRPCPRCAGGGKRPEKSQRVNRPMKKWGWLGTIGVLPSAMLPLLPSFSCPLCVAAYAGVLSSLGLGFFHNERVLAPLIVAFLAISVGSVAWTTRSHRRGLPLAATFIGALAIGFGRLVWSFPVLVYVGIGLLMVGAMWNLVLKLQAGREETAGVS